MRAIFHFFLLAVLLSACKSSHQQAKLPFNQLRNSYSNVDSVQLKHLDWKAEVDFERKRISATATWSFRNLTKSKTIRLDAYDLHINSIEVNGKPASYRMGEFNVDYGNGLEVQIQEGDSLLKVNYYTGSSAKAIQWLSPEQTAGKIKPFLFTQCESIQARSLIPCQDVPELRITYSATVKVPIGMMALMSAKNPTKKSSDGNYQLNMELPIPSYLIALAVGDIEYMAIDERTGVYAEPVMLARAHSEFQEMPKMMLAAEKLCGPYRWGNYDILVAPPSFPIGGMENPRLTFATPTIIAGDRSLVSLIAHEMAHSWSGNLVTNATWEDIWLNEGFTTYFERRIMEELAGKSYNEMLWEIGIQDMESDLKDFGISNPDTRLRIELNGRNPENAFSNIPYEKGAVFLKTLEEQLGREKFDAYLNSYFSHFAFQSINTAKCLKFMDSCLFQGDTNLRNELKVKEWIFNTGVPTNFVHTIPQRFEAVDKQRIKFEAAGDVTKLSTKEWTSHEWLHFLRRLNRPISLEQMKSLDEAFHLTQTGNSEVAAEWFKLSISSKYSPANASIEKFLGSVGRKKFLEPIYKELIKTEEGRTAANRIFEKSKSAYHPLTAIKIQRILAQ